MGDSRLYPQRPLLAASVACFREKRVLLATRGKPPMEHLYTLPGGLVEPGETLMEAALRELHEEVGVRAAPLGFLQNVEVIERDEAGHIKHHIVIAAHAALWVSGEARTGPEARDVQWITQENIAGLPTTPGLLEVLGRAFALARAAGA